MLAGQALVETRGIEPLTPALQMWIRVRGRSFYRGRGRTRGAVVDPG
jgi:hypothetical protein